jgi:hypothetical protein
MQELLAQTFMVLKSPMVNMRDVLYYPLQRWNYKSFDPALAGEEHLLAATESATAKSIPEFKKVKIAEEVKMLGDPNLVEISLWESVLTGMEDYLFRGQACQSDTQVTSFVVTAPDTNKSLA